MKKRFRKWGPWLAAAFLIYGLVFYVAPLFFPLPEELEYPPSSGLAILDQEGRVIRRLLEGDLRSDAPATFEEFPTSLVEATIAAEDSRFYFHNGIDLLGILRSLRDASIQGRFSSGASTITQQTIKIYSPPRKRNLRTKVIELFSARKLEMFASKEKILTAYLNRLPYGNQLTGARAAARGYFGKPLEDLSVAESALLAGLPNKPTFLNPLTNPTAAQKRQLWILQRMEEEKFLTHAERNAAGKTALRFQESPGAEFFAPHFTEHLIHQKQEILEAKSTPKSEIRTTLDLSLQHFVENTVSSELIRIAPEAGGLGGLQGAVVVIENTSGSVRALVGSRSFSSSASGQINGAWTPRSAGSTLKPFTYLLALERGYSAASILADTPIEYITATGSYKPVNFNRRYEGPVSLRHALANSLNVPAVKLLNEIGGPSVLFSCLNDDLQFSTLCEKNSDYGLGLTLGNAEVRLLELTNAYATLARLGNFLPYRFLEKGTLPNPYRVFGEEESWLIADILSDEKARAKAFGLHSPLSLPFRVAAKTGTSTDFRDNWTIGYTPRFTVGVWVGRFDNRPLQKLSGARGAAPLFHAVMKELYREASPAWFSPPPNAYQKLVDRWSGKIAPQANRLHESRTRKEWFLSGTGETASSEDYDNQERTILPTLYSDWAQSTDGLSCEGFSIDSSRNEPVHRTTLRITSPMEGTVALLDPDLPGRGAKFPLRISGVDSASVSWKSDTLTIIQDGTETWALLKPGNHKIAAKETTSGSVVETAFEVRAL